MNNIPVDVTLCDSSGESILDVATDPCQELLMPLVSRSEIVTTVCIDLDYNDCCHFPVEGTSFSIGTLVLLPWDTWSAVQRKLKMLFTTYVSHMDLGLKTKKTNRLDPEASTDYIQYSLGLTENSIAHFVIGSHKLPPGQEITYKPYELLCNNNLRKITIHLKDGVGCHDAVAFDVLFPPTSIQNYLRLLDQYRSVIFYGPEGTGKSYLTQRLAYCLSCKEQQNGRCPTIYHVQLHADFSHDNLIEVLKQKGCILSTADAASSNSAPILVFEDLEKINVMKVFGKLLYTIENRGKLHPFKLTDEVDYYFVSSFYLLATMNKSRSTGLELAVQQRFRWVNFRLDVEPVHSILPRFLLRNLLSAFGGKLPVPESPVFRAVEWIVCIWQRLNDGLVKLGLPDVVFGPTMFYSCPVESGKPEEIFSWLCSLWNEKISPIVKEGVVRGTGKESSKDGRNKVANTALYVLMQRAIVPSLPLIGQEKEKYLSTFAGSNELDISMKMDKNKSVKSVFNIGKSSIPNGQFQSKVTDSSQARKKNRNSFGFESRPSYSFTPSIKRRSLSDAAINRNEQLESKSQGDQTDRQAKVAKLELRSPVSFSPVSLAFSTASDITTRSMPSLCPTKSQSVGNRNSQIPIPTKKSRSSENLYTEVVQTKNSLPQNPASPFSFLLTTTSSSLSSFKYLEVRSPRKKHHSEPSSEEGSGDSIRRNIRESGGAMKRHSITTRSNYQS